MQLIDAMYAGILQINEIQNNCLSKFLMELLSDHVGGNRRRREGMVQEEEGSRETGGGRTLRFIRIFSQ